VKRVEDRLKLLEVLPQGGIVAELGTYKGTYADSILKINKPLELYLVDHWDDVPNPWPNKEEQETNYHILCERYIFEPRVMLAKVDTLVFMTERTHKTFIFFFLYLYFLYLTVF